MTSISWWGEVTTQNQAAVIADNAQWRDARLALFRKIKTVLEKHNIVHWVDSGSLLGAWRNGQMIPHDSDTDIGIAGKEMHAEACRVLRQDLPELGYKTATYSDKLEVYDPTSPEIPWGSNGDMWHKVSCDIDLYVRQPDGWQQQYFNFGIDQKRIRHEDLFPLGTIVFEGETCAAPHRPQAYLETIYGYLGADARYDADLQTFVAPPADAAETTDVEDDAE